MRIGTIILKPTGKLVVKSEDGTRQAVLDASSVLVTDVDAEGDQVLVRLDTSKPDHLLQVAQQHFRQKVEPPKDAPPEWMPPTAVAAVKAAAVPNRWNVTD